MAQLVILSAGHKPGLDSGAIGQGQQEANDTIRICDRVAVLLRAWGVKVDYEPNDVGGLVAEINWVNARYKNLNDGWAIQIHRNAGGGTGSEIWTPSNPDDTSIAMAQAIDTSLAKITGLRDRGVKFAQNSQWGKLGWTDDTNTYATLVEARFIDVDDISDTADMTDAYAIAVGICNYYGVPVGKTPEEVAAANAAAVAAEAARAKSAQEAAAAKQAAIDAENARLAAKKLAEDAVVAKQAEDAAAAKKLSDDKAVAAKLAAEKAEADRVAANTVLHDTALNSMFTNWLRELFIKISNWFISWRK